MEVLSTPGFENNEIAIFTDFTREIEEIINSYSPSDYVSEGSNAMTRKVHKIRDNIKRRINEARKTSEMTFEDLENMIKIFNNYHYKHDILYLSERDIYYTQIRWFINIIFDIVPFDLFFRFSDLINRIISDDVSNRIRFIEKIANEITDIEPNELHKYIEPNELHKYIEENNLLPVTKDEIKDYTFDNLFNESIKVLIFESEEILIHGVESDRVSSKWVLGDESYSYLSFYLRDNLDELYADLIRNSLGFNPHDFVNDLTPYQEKQERYEIMEKIAYIANCSKIDLQNLQDHTKMLTNIIKEVNEYLQILGEEINFVNLTFEEENLQNLLKEVTNFRLTRTEGVHPEWTKNQIDGLITEWIITLRSLISNLITFLRNNQSTPILK